MLGRLSLMLPLISILGCSDRTVQRDRPSGGELGKADGIASCDGACGDRAPGGCWCDAVCGLYGDCCADKPVLCDGARPPDGAPTTDGGVPLPDGPSADNLCDEQCLAESPFLCVQKQSYSDTHCVECQTDAHCENNPNAFGSRCDSSAGFCTCERSRDCIDNPNGGACDAVYSACSCGGDSDCPVGKACVVEVAPAGYGDPGLMACGDPCGSNADCTEAGKPLCDSQTGRCVACLSDSDCDAVGAPLCADLGRGKKVCVECYADTHCANSEYGGRCDANYCTCDDASDCTSPNALGMACISRSTSLGSYRACGCDQADSSQCAGNANGTICSLEYRACSCTGDASCPDPNRSACPATTTTLQRCQAE